MRELGLGASDELLQQVMDVMDKDRSGEVSLAEFERLCPPQSSGGSAAAPAETTAGTTSDGGIERLRSLLQTAQSHGIDVAQSFAHFDVDGDGNITHSEFTAAIKTLPGI
ncbi:hypothetical protein PINS_up005883 [Pythium insidiosum]|nr:hypothetical protein PINS_up005883 [Pythium insidiosum]